MKTKQLSLFTGWWIVWHLRHCCNPKFSEAGGGRWGGGKLSGLHETDCAQGESKQCFGCSQQAGRRPVFILTSTHAQLGWPLPSNTHPKCVWCMCVRERAREGAREKERDCWISEHHLHPSIHPSNCPSSPPPRSSTSPQGRENTPAAVAAFVTPSSSDRKDRAELCFQRRGGRK